MSVEWTRSVPSLGMPAIVLSLLGLASAQLPAGARAALRAPARAEEVRALWVLHTSLTDPRAITAMVRAARNNGFNTLLVQVRSRGDAYYESALEPRGPGLAPSAFDPLQTIIAAAQPEGIRVHAWMNVNLISSARALPAARTHLIYRHPEWLMVPRDLAPEMLRMDPKSPGYLGTLTRWTRGRRDAIEGLYISPIPQGAVAHLAQVVSDVLTRYELDGVHLDYVRYPGLQFDYSATALAEFRASVLDDLSLEERERLDARAAGEPLIFADMFPERWAGFRRSRLTTLLRRIRTAVTAARPGALLSAAVVPDSVEAAEGRFQDWRTWVETGLLDVVCPMAYAPDAATFARQIRAARDLAGAARVWAGIGAYRLTPARTIENIRTARRLGAAGMVLFSYDSLKDRSQPSNYLSQVGRAVFGEPPSISSR